MIVGKGDSEEQDNQFLHRGIARRAFERRFQLADHVEVKARILSTVFSRSILYAKSRGDETEED